MNGSLEVEILKELPEEVSRMYPEGTIPRKLP